MFVFITFLTFKFSFHYFYILVLHAVFGKHRFGSSAIGQIGKTAFTAEFLTVANTLLIHRILFLSYASRTVFADAHLGI